jgi:hypothetical protein
VVTDAVVIEATLDVVLSAVESVFDLVAGGFCDEVSTGAAEDVGCGGLGSSIRLQVLTSSTAI